MSGVNFPAAKRQKKEENKDEDRKPAAVLAKTISLPCLGQICAFSDVKTLLALRRASKCWKLAVNKEVDSRQKVVVTNFPKRTEGEGPAGNNDGHLCVRMDRLEIEKEWTHGYESDEQIAMSAAQFASESDVLPEILNDVAAALEYSSVYSYGGGMWRVELTIGTTMHLREKFQTWREMKSALRNEDDQLDSQSATKILDDLFVLMMPSSAAWKWNVRSVDIRYVNRHSREGQVVVETTFLLEKSTKEVDVNSDQEHQKEQEDENSIPNRFRITSKFTKVDIHPEPIVSLLHIHQNLLRRI